MGLNHTNITEGNSSMRRWERSSWNASNRTARNSSLRRWESNSWNASNSTARDFNNSGRSRQNNGTNGTKDERKQYGRECVCETSNGTMIRGVMEEEDPASQEEEDPASQEEEAQENLEGEGLTETTLLEEETREVTGAVLQNEASQGEEQEAESEEAAVPHNAEEESGSNAEEQSGSNSEEVSNAEEQSGSNAKEQSGSNVEEEPVSSRALTKNKRHEIHAMGRILRIRPLQANQ